MSQPNDKYSKKARFKAFDAMTAATVSQAMQQLIEDPLKSRVFNEIFQNNSAYHDQSTIDDAKQEFFLYILQRDAKQEFFLDLYNSYFFRFWLSRYCHKQLRSKTSRFYKKYKREELYEDADELDLPIIEEFALTNIYPSKDHLIFALKRIVLSLDESVYPIELKYLFIAFYLDLNRPLSEMNYTQFSKETKIPYETVRKLIKSISKEVHNKLIDQHNGDINEKKKKKGKNNLPLLVQYADSEIVCLTQNNQNSTNIRS